MNAVVPAGALDYQHHPRLGGTGGVAAGRPLVSHAPLNCNCIALGDGNPACINNTHSKQACASKVFHFPPTPSRMSFAVVFVAAAGRLCFKS
jgi:hypothetical protein